MVCLSSPAEIPTWNRSGLSLLPGDPAPEVSKASRPPCSAPWDRWVPSVLPADWPTFAAVAGAQSKSLHALRPLKGWIILTQGKWVLLTPLWGFWLVQARYYTLDSPLSSSAKCSPGRVHSFRSWGWLVKISEYALYSRIHSFEIKRK